MSPSAPPSERRGWLFVVLGVEILLFLPSLLTSGLIRAPLPKISEATRLFYPWNIFWRDEVAAGRLPFWDPFMFGGFPTFAEPQTQTFYPSHLLWLILPADLAFKLSFLLHVLLGSWLMYRLVRTLGASRFGASLSALVYGLQGQLVVFIYAGWIHQVCPMAWAPGVVWLLCRAFLHAHPRRSIAGASVMLGVQVLSGHPEWVRYTLFLVWLLVLGGRDLQRSLPRRLAIGASVTAIGLLIAGLQLLPLAQATLLSPRGQHAMNGVVRTGAGLPILSLPTLIVPRLFGPWDPSISVDGLVHKLSGSLVNFGESLVYVGIVPLVLAFVALRTRRGTREVFWAGVGAAGLLFAMNDWTHLQSALDRLLPLDATFRSPARWVFLTNFSLAVLAGLGASRLERLNPSRMARAGVIISGALAAAAAMLFLLRGPLVDLALARIHVPADLVPRITATASTPGELGWWALGQAAGALLTSAIVIAVSTMVLSRACRRWNALAAAVVLIVAAADLAIYDGPFLSSVVPLDAVYETEARVLAPVAGRPSAAITADRVAILPSGENTTNVFRVRSLLGYDGFTLAEWERVWSAPERTDPAVRAALGATHVLTEGPPISLVPLPSPRGHLWWTARAITAPTADAATALLSRAAAEGAVVLEAGLDAPRSGASAPPADVVVEDDVPGRLRARIQAAEPGWAVFTEMFYPGWTGRVNGTSAPILRAFGAMQAVQLPAGSSTIELTFRPAIVWWGLASTMLGLALALWLFSSPVWRSRGRLRLAGHPSRSVPVPPRPA